MIRDAGWPLGEVRLGVGRRADAGEILRVDVELLPRSQRTDTECAAKVGVRAHRARRRVLVERRRTTDRWRSSAGRSKRTSRSSGARPRGTRRPASIEAPSCSGLLGPDANRRVPDGNVAVSCRSRFASLPTDARAGASDESADAVVRVTSSPACVLARARADTGSTAASARRPRRRMTEIGGATKLVGLIGWPVDLSLSPRMQNAAFAALGLDWAYVPLPTPPERLEDAVKGLAALGFAGANVTTPHKRAAAALCGADAPSVNTLVVRDGRVEGRTTDAAILAGLTAESPVIIGDGGAATAFVQALPRRGRYLAADRLAPGRRGRGSRRQRDLRARRGARRARPGSDARRSPVSGDRDRALPRGARVRRSSEDWRFSSRREPPRSSSGPACPPRSTRCGRP